MIHSTRPAPTPPETQPATTIRRRLRATAASLLALTTLSLGFSAPARAATDPLITFQYTTTIDTTDVGGAPDTPLTLTYRFDPNLPSGSGGGSPEIGFSDYGPLDRVILRIGDQCLAQSATGAISIYDGPNSLFVEDAYVAALNPAPSSGTKLFGLDLRLAQLVLVDFNGTMFNNTALPTTTNFAAAAQEQQTTILLFNPGTRRFVSLFAGGAPGTLEAIDPVARIADIQTRLLAENLNNGIQTALQNPLKKASEYLNDATTSNDGNAIKELQKFIDQVNALPQTVITPNQAQGLIGAANKAISTVNALQPC